MLHGKVEERSVLNTARTGTWSEIDLSFEDSYQDCQDSVEPAPEAQVGTKRKKPLGLSGTASQVLVAEVDIIEGQKYCERKKVAHVHADCLTG